MVEYLVLELKFGEQCIEHPNMDKIQVIFSSAIGGLYTLQFQEVMEQAFVILLMIFIGYFVL